MTMAPAVYYMAQADPRGKRDDGYAMAALLVAIAVMGILMSVALPTWRQMVQREKEEELVFRGEQYVRAIRLFGSRYAGAYPPNIDTLVQQKFLRKKYKDPMVEGGEFQVLDQAALMSVQRGQQNRGRGATGDRAGSTGGTPTFSFDPRSGTSMQSGTPVRQVGQRGAVMGVASQSTETSLRLYNGRDKYNEWLFIYTGATRGGQRGERGNRGTGPGGDPSIRTPFLLGDDQRGGVGTPRGGRGAGAMRGGPGVERGGQAQPRRGPGGLP